MSTTSSTTDTTPFPSSSTSTSSSGASSSLSPSPPSSSSDTTSSTAPTTSAPADSPTSATLPPSNPPPASTIQPSFPPPLGSPPLSQQPAPFLSSISPTTTQGQSNIQPMTSSTPFSLLTTLTTPSTSIMQVTSMGTVDGRVFTTTFQITTVRPPGSVVSSPPRPGGSGARTGAIVGGVVGGIAFILLLILAILLHLRHRRRQRAGVEFDGNFDPARVSESRRVTLDLDDDGMGGRLGGGVVMPFLYESVGADVDAEDTEMGERGAGAGAIATGTGAGAATMGARCMEQRSGEIQRDHDGNPTTEYNEADILRGRHYPGSGFGIGTELGSIPPIVVGSDPDFRAGTDSVSTPSSAYHGIPPLDPQHMQPASASASRLFGLGPRNGDRSPADG